MVCICGYQLLESADEIAQGKNAIEAGKKTGIQHFIWSTLPQFESISNGELDLPHFTAKAKVDNMVRSARFKSLHIWSGTVLFSKSNGMLAPQPKEDGTTGWTLPIDPTKKVILMSDINDLGKVVQVHFCNPKKLVMVVIFITTELNSFK